LAIGSRAARPPTIGSPTEHDPTGAGASRRDLQSAGQPPGQPVGG
jgi:hypothetical protein